MDDYSDSSTPSRPSKRQRRDPSGDSPFDLAERAHLSQQPSFSLNTSPVHRPGALQSLRNAVGNLRTTFVRDKTSSPSTKEGADNARNFPWWNQPMLSTSNSIPVDDVMHEEFLKGSVSANEAGNISSMQIEPAGQDVDIPESRDNADSPQVGISTEISRQSSRISDMLMDVEEHTDREHHDRQHSFPEHHTIELDKDTTITIGLEATTPAKRGRGRPRKIKIEETPGKRKRGRPRKYPRPEDMRDELGNTESPASTRPVATPRITPKKSRPLVEREGIIPSSAPESVDDDELQGTGNLRTSTRTRRLPSRYSNDVPHGEPSQLIEFTSSSKNSSVHRTPKRSPLVHSDENQRTAERELGFRDIPSIPRYGSPVLADDLMDSSEKRSVIVHIEEEKETDKDLEHPDTVQMDIDQPVIINPTGKSKLKVSKPRVALLQHEEVIDELAFDDAALSSFSPEFKAQLQQALEDGSVDRQIEALKTVLLERVTGKRRMRLIGLDDEYNKVYQLVEQTVVAGEGNSMLVIGARGSGKSTLVETVVANIGAKNKDDFHVIRLNGFIHTDDKLALREIWRQLGREMEVEHEENGKVASYADTLASLLALLSHPSELAGAETDTAAKSVIFIIDEFDLFASHPRQTLLYNLFDIAQSRKAPIAVLGLTTRVDVSEYLEKRVKSRFSHRYVYLSLPKSLSAYREICGAALAIDQEELRQQGTTQMHYLYHSTESEMASSILTSSQATNLLRVWSYLIESLPTRDPLFAEHQARMFYTTASLPAFLTLCLVPLSVLTSKSLLALASRSYTFLDTASLLAPPDSKLTLLSGLSELELSLLIAAARLDIISDMDICNFEMVYEEYVGLAAKVKLNSAASGANASGGVGRVWGRDVALGAWENLLDLELIMAAVGGGRLAPGVAQSARKWVRVDVALEEIEGSVPGISGTLAKWCREI